MNISHISLLKCPNCGEKKLEHENFSTTKISTNFIEEGIVWCEQCLSWFPIEGKILDLLIGNLIYAKRRKSFLSRHALWFRKKGFPRTTTIASHTSLSDQKTQQKHSDWFGDNSELSYEEYTSTPFLRAATEHIYCLLFEQMRENALVVEIGCGIGNHTLKMARKGAQVIAFDISEVVVRKAQDNFIQQYYPQPNSRRDDTSNLQEGGASFLLADATNIPLHGEQFDFALLFGILHHLPNPSVGCAEAIRLLKHGGTFLASENNRSCFRWCFDMLQRMHALWKEKAGKEPIMSNQDFHRWLDPLNIEFHTETSIFLPPQLFWLLPNSWVKPVLGFSDWLGQHTPWLRKNGGWINVVGKKI